MTPTRQRGATTRPVGLLVVPLARNDAPALAMHGLLGDEAMLLETCARRELYLAGPSGPRLFRWAEQLVGCASLVQAQSGVGAWRHLARVSSGLDSPILGEHEIAEQLQSALASATQRGLAGSVLRSHVDWALSVARIVRRSAGFRPNRVGLGPAVADLMTSVLGPDPSQQAAIALVGAGHCASHVAAALASRGFPPTVVINRTAASAQTLAATMGAHAAAFENLPEIVASSDAVIVAVSGQARLPMISQCSVRPTQLLVDLRARADHAEPWDIGARTTLSLEDVHHHQRSAQTDLARRLTVAHAIVERAIIERATSAEHAVIEAALADLYREMPHLIRSISDLATVDVASEERELLVRNLLKAALHPHVHQIRSAVHLAEEGLRHA